MIPMPSGVRVWIATGHTDMRRGMQGLALQVQEQLKRDLSEHAVAYLFIDGIAERLRPGQRREAVLAAWGIGEDGRKSLLGLMAGSKEDVETVRAFFQDLRARGLGDPLLVVSDGAPGIIRAIEECFPRSARQRCLAHRMRNLAAKVSADPWPEFKARVTACYQAPSRAIARQLAAGLRADYANVLPSALACFEDDFEACIAHLRLPVTHRRFARTTNLLERSARSSEPPNDGAVCASRSSNSDRSPLSEKNSTTNIMLQSRRWPGQPSPEFPANPSLDRWSSWPDAKNHQANQPHAPGRSGAYLAVHGRRLPTGLIQPPNERQSLPERDGMRFCSRGRSPPARCTKSPSDCGDRREIDDATDARRAIRLHFGGRQFGVRRALRVGGEQRGASPRDQIERGHGASDRSSIIGESIAT